MRWITVSMLALSTGACGDGGRAPPPASLQVDSGVGGSGGVGTEPFDASTDGPTHDVQTPRDGAGDSSVDAPAEADAGPDSPPHHDAATDAFEDVASPPLDLRVLIVGASDTSPQSTASIVQDLIGAAGIVDSIVVEAVTAPSLLEFFYQWTERDTRLQRLADAWDYVVLADPTSTLTRGPELHFEGIRAVAELARSQGATPVLLMTASASPPPNSMGLVGSDTCFFANDGSCNDGTNSQGHWCAFGTDATDCGPHPTSLAPRYSTEDLTWRVGIGSGCVVVPAGLSAARLGMTRGELPAVAAASLYTALTGDDAAATGYVPTFTPEAEWQRIASEVLAQYTRDQVATHYTGEYEGAVRIDAVPLPATYRFMVSGTSSEAGFRTAMGRLLDRESVAHESVHLPNCNSSRVFDANCLSVATPFFQSDAFYVLYARRYAVSQADIEAVAPTVMAQVYDRHRDSPDHGGGAALDEIFPRSLEAFGAARTRGVAWLPQHINFGKLKAEHPNANLLSDGVHATPEVQAGLASMSFTSRTGLDATASGEGAVMDSAIRLGSGTIRTLSTLSRTGEHIPDLLENRTAP